MAGIVMAQKSTTLLTFVMYSFNALAVVTLVLFLISTGYSSPPSVPLGFTETRRRWQQSMEKCGSSLRLWCHTDISQAYIKLFPDYFY